MILTCLFCLDAQRFETDVFKISCLIEKKEKGKEFTNMEFLSFVNRK